MRKASYIIVFALLMLGSMNGAGKARSAGNNDVPGGSPRLPGLLGDSGKIGDYARALEPREFSFPEDHGPHPAFRNEWWYVTGNLNGRDGRRFGFELTFFRFALAPETGSVKPDSSAWRTNQLYVGHFAITDVLGEDFYVAERVARAALGLAGAAANPFHVQVEDWWLKGFPEESVERTTWLLHAEDKRFGLTLTLVPQSPPVLQGVAGLSQKSSEPGFASYYYSIPRMRSQGTLRIDGDIYDVNGLSWLDREWGSSALSKNQQGWDWFGLQLSDGSSLMYYRLRRVDGAVDPHSAGTWIPEGGEPVYLAEDDVTITVRDYWDSPLGGRYPMAWTVEIPDLELSLKVDPVLDAQELATYVRYWEGAVDVAGKRKNREISGRGYVELTGYSDAALLPAEERQ